MSTSPAIESRGLEKRFGTKRAVCPFEVEIEPGVVTGLLGPNGSGKSTLLRMLTGLVRPDGGTATVAGIPLRGDGAAIRKRVSYMPGEVALYKDLTGTRHLKWLLRGRGREALSRALEICGDMALPLERRVRGYSHGMKRQLLIAATLGPKLPVRILDEPTEGLDPTKRAEVLDLLERESRAGAAVLLSSHHLDEVNRACERLLFLNEGLLLAQETPENLRAQARRLVRIEWHEEVVADDFSDILSSFGAQEIRTDGPRAYVVLPTPDPRAFLAALTKAVDLPAPTVLAYGEPSLRELYRELYGVEGV